MSTPAIQNLPLGLVGLLGIKSGGQYPRDLANTVAPVLDIEKWIQYGNYEEAGVDIAALNGTGFKAFAGNSTVPTGELWVITGSLIQKTAQNAAGQTLQFAAAATADLTSAAQLLGDPSPRTSGVNTQPAAKYDYGTILRPGSTMGLWVFEEAGGPHVINCWFRRVVVPL